MKRQIIVLGVLASLVTCFFVYGHYRRKAESTATNRLVQLRRQAWVAEAVKEWDKGTFTSDGFSQATAQAVVGTTNVTEMGSADEQPKVIDLQSNLTSEQLTKLSDITKRFFTTFGKTNIGFEDYLSFKTGSRHFRYNFGGIVGEIITNYTRDGALVLPSNLSEIEKARRIWECLTADDENLRGGARPVITSVDLKTIRIWVYDGRDTSYAAGGLSLRVLNNMSKAAINTLIEYGDTPARIVERNGTFKYVAISAICHFNTSPNPGPATVGLYWSDKEHDWMPWEFVSDGSSRFYLLF